MSTTSTIDISPETHVADIVIANPATARVFEQHRIDFCCHGRRPLDEACSEAGVATAGVIDELALVDSPRQTAPPTDIGGLIGYVVSTHHTYLRRELPRLSALMDKVVAAHGKNHPEVGSVRRLLAEVSADLLPHLEKEEQVLFPLTIRLLGAVGPLDFHCGSLGNPIRVMLAEHDRVGELLAELRSASADYNPPADACPTWRALYAGLAELESDTFRHVHLENNLLFPAISELEARFA
jgi:regulator of cell morphogenesis and NO signaling